MISIIIGGDIVPSFGNVEAFKQGQISEIIDGECEKLLKYADFRVFNLETPLTDELSPINKEGAAFAVSTLSVNGLKALGANVIGVANNHCRDQGAAAMKKTLDILAENGIETVGHGIDYKDCVSTAFVSKDGITVAIIACCEVEFTVFGDGEVGALPYHDYYVNKAIEQAKTRADAVIVTYHGGKEYYRYGAPYLRERCRLMIDCGADIVLCQHSHCIGCREEYNGGTVLYGQGNFIFRQKNNLPETKEGLLVKLSVDKQYLNVEYVPIYLDETDRACVALGEKKEAILRAFDERSEYFSKTGGAPEDYLRFALEKKSTYYSRFRGSASLLRFVHKILNRLGRNIYSKRDKLAIRNLLQNEAHRDVFIRSLEYENGNADN